MWRAVGIWNIMWRAVGIWSYSCGDFFFFFLNIILCNKQMVLLLMWQTRCIMIIVSAAWICCLIARSPQMDFFFKFLNEKQVVENFLAHACCLVTLVYLRSVSTIIWWKDKKLPENGIVLHLLLLLYKMMCRNFLSNFPASPSRGCYGVVLELAKVDLKELIFKWPWKLDDYMDNCVWTVFNNEKMKNCFSGLRADFL